MNEIFLVYENADRTEGRGPMVLVENSGFFTSEDEAWKFADTIPGVMGTKPASGSWRTEKYADVKVVRFTKHDEEKKKKIISLEVEIAKLQRDLAKLKGDK